MAACPLHAHMPDCSLLLSLLPRLLPCSSVQQASCAASSFSSVSYCVQQTKVAFTPEDGSAAQGISVSVSNSFLSRHGSLPVPSVSCSLHSLPGTWGVRPIPHGLCLPTCMLLPVAGSSPPQTPDRKGGPKVGVSGWGGLGWDSKRPRSEHHHSDVNWQRCFGLFVLFSHWALGQPCSVLCLRRTVLTQEAAQAAPSMTELKSRELRQLAFTTCC